VKTVLDMPVFVENEMFNVYYLVSIQEASQAENTDMKQNNMIYVEKLFANQRNYVSRSQNKSYRDTAAPAYLV
jgi:hypothetical protein